MDYEDLTPEQLDAYYDRINKEIDEALYGEQKCPPTNPLDGKVIVDRELITVIVAAYKNELLPLAKSALKQALAADLTGWAAVPVETNDDMKVATCIRDSEGYMLPLTYLEAYRAMLAASPPLPQKEGE